MKNNKNAEFFKRIEISKCFDQYSMSQSKMVDNYFKKFYTFLLSDGRQLYFRFNDDNFVKMMGLNVDEVKERVDKSDKLSYAVHKEKYDFIKYVLNGEMSLDIKKSLNCSMVIKELFNISYNSVLGFLEYDEDRMICLVKNERDYYTSLILKRKDNNIYEIEDIKNINLEELFKNRTLLLPNLYAIIRKKEDKYDYEIREINDSNKAVIEENNKGITSQYNVKILEPSEETKKLKLELK